MRSIRLQVLVLLSAAAVLFVSCASTSGTGDGPSWIVRTYDRARSERTYLCAVGSGGSRQEAVDAAFASLSRTFASEIRSVSAFSDFHTADGLSGDVPVFVDSSSMLEQGSVTSSVGKVVGAEIVDTYRSEEGQCFARVALDRKKTSALYRSELTELERAVKAVERRAGNAGDPLSRYFVLRSALPYARRHRDLADQVQVLEKKPYGKAVLTSLENQLLGLASSVAVSVTVDAPAGTSAAVSSAFSSVLQDFGFRVVPDADIALSVSYGVRPVVMEGSPYSYVRYDVSVNLAGPDIVAVSLYRGERVAALDTEDAYRKALREATGTVPSAFAALLESRLGGGDDR